MGVFLLALGLILALAVQDRIDAIDLTLIGWILAGAGALVIVLTALQLNRSRGSATRGHHDALRRHPDHHRAAEPDRPAARDLTDDHPTAGTPGVPAVGMSGANSLSINSSC